jgi:hypothetical protein
MARETPHTKSCRAQRGNRQGGLAKRRRPEPRARRAELHKRRSTIGRSQRGSEHVEHGEDDVNLRPPSEASGVDDTFWRMATRRDNPHGGSCVCAAERRRPKGPDRSLWHKDQGQPAKAGGPGRRDTATRLGWPAHRGRARAAGELFRRQARAEGTSATGILTRRAETRNVALFMSSPAVAHKTLTGQPRKNQRVES